MDFTKAKRIPPLTASLGQACYACFKTEGEGITLRRCTGCRSIQYCSAGCQQANWKEHKGICKAFQKLENEPVLRMSLLFALVDEPTTDFYSLDTIIATMVANQERYLEQVLNRRLTIPERNLLGWEPRCLACARTDRVIRMEAVENGSTSTPNTLKACHACKMAFYCSDHHWDAVQHKHAGEPAEDGHDGLTQCHMNQEIRQDIAFASIMEAAKMGQFKWAPERVKPSWASLKDTNWEAEFASRLVQDFGISTEAAGPFLRASSEALSMPMTILWALENLNLDDSWTRKETLIIHLLGAYQVEVMNADTFEEVLHRLPEVKKLNLVLCGPELATLTTVRERSQVMDMETCPNCAGQRRKRVQQLFTQKYHEYAQSLGSNFIKPDLAVAFNSGASQEGSESWKETMSFLVKNNIPSVFTAYNREEAEAEAKLLKAAGAQLIPRLGPTRNAWGSISFKKEPSRVTGFYSVNGWLAGGFR
ncbi:putative zinc finger mynd domain-containing protein 17 [Lyophyllum shimeji]|uniref:Zinc finger mynd domain-containing protein 17 n=1 Tax=Lyophyllum shimeji TaxID=47721 RepID=A0A9P3PZ85_LYOSH|nr:putative zinc finger mynd domain-containing protein 17 [Lyophyllum shimeji]